MKNTTTGRKWGVETKILKHCDVVTENVGKLCIGVGTLIGSRKNSSCRWDSTVSRDTVMRLHCTLNV